MTVFPIDAIIRRNVTFSRQKLSGIFDILPGPNRRKCQRLKFMLEGYASWYRRANLQDQATAARTDQREVLEGIIYGSARMLQRALGHLGTAPDAEFLFQQAAGLFSNDGSYRKKRTQFNAALNDPIEHEVQLRWWARRALKAYSSSSPQGGPKLQMTRALLIQELCLLFEGLAGHAITHTASRGRPTSPGGKFVMACVKLIDPQIPETRVSTGLAHFVRYPPDRSIKKLAG